MITKEYSEINGRQAVLQKSDLGVKIRSIETGSLYDDAFDYEDLNREYTETDIPIIIEEDNLDV